MTLAQLRVFLAVARHGSVNRAAAELSVTQPAVSAAVAALERELGVALVTRQGRGIRLTPSGQALARFARQSLALLEQGRDAALAAARPGRGRLRIAAVTTAGEYVVPPILNAFQRRYPEVEIALEVSNRALVLERLETSEADLAVGGRPPHNGRIEGQPVLRNDLVLIASPDHPLARRRSIEPAALDVTWLLREPGSGTRATTEEFLAAHGLQPRRILTLGSNGAVKQAAAVGLGVTLISAQAVALEFAAGTLTRLGVRGTPLRRQWFALRVRDGYLPGPARAFLDFTATAGARRAVREALRPPLRSP
ncbi:MAG TPA: LysR substrate-binding domain-containing protein [Actinomycetes bacterium]|jgi:DNA-binding transcriptional LysR family regulator|nr:LysR substrate-binding domain-containing protein [Actinomycetes bacterium]